MKVIIIGGDAAGMSAAARLKRNLKEQVEITVYEKEGIVSYGACGIPFYVSGHIPDAASLIARTPEQFIESGIKLKTFHRVEQVDTKNKRVTVADLNGGQRFEEQYDYLLVATGARVNDIAAVPPGVQGVYRPRTIPETVALKEALMAEGTRHVVVFGAGAIALEMAAACREQGREVSILARSTVMSPLDGEFSEKIIEELAAHGIRVYQKATLLQVEAESGRISGLRVKVGEEALQLPCQLLINAAGIQANTELIDVEKLPNGAIMVDEEMRTSVDSVFAAGDCSAMRSHITGAYQHAPLGSNANKQGRIVADVLAGRPAVKLKLIGSTAIKLIDSDVAKVGLSEKDAKKLGLPYRTNAVSAHSYAGYYSDDMVDIKLVYHAETRKILGAQLFGKGSVAERASYYAIAMSADVGIDEMGMMDLCYSPPFNGVWDAALVAANTAK